ncbi:MAG: hypothetical protein CEN89_472 [Candidatus Berkelbacteria bacterium Licking1014_7]|uniref:Uncharacterized protein n=1 Tax=Candidatus Berkelbacteria bacterium Licking1014_7 TaxID=2017147 RepID=A0A554LIT1_9BACT|nr:MAG: hypothetical protein CEN89_472 [Candidatus Berkelbacteria bacterium Licking1014_7]
MKIIQINTCENPASIKLVVDGKVVKKIIWQQGKGKAEKLLKNIDFLLSKNRLSVLRVDSFEVGAHCEAGSYTGHRIGVAVANAINFVLGKPPHLYSRAPTTNTLVWGRGFLQRCGGKKVKMIIPTYGKAPKITKKIPN